MQSFIQYRKFGKAVEEQLNRDRTKTQKTNLATNDSDSSPEKDSQAFAINNDTEKGERPESDDNGRQAKGIDETADASPQEEAEDVEEPEEAEEIEEKPAERGQMGRSLSRQSTRSVRSLGTRLGQTLTGVNVRDRTTNEGGDRSKQVFVVDFQGPKDPLNPHAWSFGRRIYATIVIAQIGASVGIASSISSSALRPAAAEFHVAEVVESLATGLFLVGFGVGALFAGPISETVGRNPVYIGTMVLFMIFVMASALAPNLGAQLAFQFIAGFFGSTPLTCAGGSIADMWDTQERVLTFPIFANAAFFGPILGPVIGGFTASSPLVGWRWVEWITLIIAAVVLFQVVFFQPETYAPIILVWKAKHLRRLTGDDRYVAPLEVRADGFFKRLSVSLYRPFLLTAKEPIVILIALYLSVVYIILFTFLDGYDYIFGDIHGTSPGITGLLFMGIGVGLCLSSALVPFIYSKANKELRKIKERGGTKLPPEFRLWYAMLGGSIAIPVSLFWMGWTSDSNISIWSPIIASVLFGYGILSVFISSYQYVIDSYEIYSASALASVTLIRYVAAGGMVVVGIPFYENLGVHYT